MVIKFDGFEFLKILEGRKRSLDIEQIGQEDFDLCFCQMCPLPKIICKYLRFSLEIKPKEPKEMRIDKFREIKELEFDIKYKLTSIREEETKEKILKLKKQIKPLESFISFSVAQAACSLRVEPLPTDLKECENCKEKVPIEKIPCAGDEVVLEESIREVSK